MKLLSKWFPRKRDFEQFMSEELRFHLEQQTGANMKAGMMPDEARRQARLQLGALESVKEGCREERRGFWLESLWADVRYGLRVLRKSPGFTIVAVFTLALGIGVNTAIFSAVNDLLLAPLPYADSAHLITVTGIKSFPTSGVMGYIGFSPDLAEMILNQSPEFERAATYSTDQLTMTGGVEPEELSVAGVHGDFFTLMGVRPLLGRPILEADTKPADQRVAVLSYALWNESFGGDPHVTARSITLNRESYTIVGVMPPRFDFGAGEKGLWISTSNDAGNIVARVKSGVTLDEVNAQLKVVSARLASKYPKVMEGCQLNAWPFGPETGGLDKPLLLLFGAVGFVLLIACVNLSSLLLARAWARRREIAIREALGATRLRLVR